MTPDEVLDQLDLPMLDGFTKYWKSYPPLHVMVAAYMGFQPKKDDDSKPPELDDKVLAQIMSQFAQTPPR